MTNQTLDRADIPADSRLNVQKNWRWLLAIGILWIVLGCFAIVLPFAATVAIELLLGAILLVGGGAQIIEALNWRGWRGFAVHALGGVLAIAVGGLLMLYPFQGILTLTLFLAIFFIVDGLFKMLSALQHRSFRGWGWLLLSGVTGIAAGGLIWFGWPSTAVWFLGLLTGIAFIVSGWSLVMLAISMRCD